MENNILPKFTNTNTLKVLCGGGKIEFAPENIEWSTIEGDLYLFECYAQIEEERLFILSGKIHFNQRRSKNQKYYLADLSDGYGHTIQKAKIKFIK